MKRPAILVLGPAREAISGVSTHVNALLGSPLGETFDLLHFQVGSEGRREGRAGKLMRFLLSPFSLAKSLVENRVALVHVNTSLNAKAFWRDLAYVAVAKLCGARVAYQVHGGMLARWRGGAAFSAFLRAAMRLPDVIVVLSRQEQAAWHVLSPSLPVEVIANGVSASFPFLKVREGKNLKLLYIGRLAAGKGLYETVEGLRQARQAGAAAELVIAGAGPEEASLRQQVRAAHLDECVRFAGPAYGEEKERLLRGADALVLASYSEGLPYAVLEAMAAGVVPIATPVGGVPDVVAHGEHGMLVAPRDARAVGQAIASLAGDRSMLARMGAACRARIASGYTIERVARDFGSLYAGLCAARLPRAAS